MRAAHFPTDPYSVRGICGTAARRASPDPLYGPTRLLQDRFDSIEVDCTLISGLSVWAYPPGPL
jgi:hypothetical protein